MTLVLAVVLLGVTPNAQATKANKQTNGTVRQRRPSQSEKAT